MYILSTRKKIKLGSCNKPYITPHALRVLKSLIKRMERI